eukprot:2908536-Rhodomonas_salina.1
MVSLDQVESGVTQSMRGNSSVSPESRVPRSCAVAAAIRLIGVVSLDDNGACGVGRQACRGRARLPDCGG